MYKQYLEEANGSNKMSITVVVNMMSQPSRAVLLMMRINDIPHKQIDVELFKTPSQTRTPELLKIQPFGTVPGFQDGSLCIWESAAMLQYLAEKKGVKEHWYPKDPAKRSLVNSYFSAHAGVRKGLTMYFFNIKLKPIVFGTSVTEEEAKQLEEGMNATLDQLESIWLKTNKFVASNDDITIADLQLIMEIWQVQGMYDVAKNRPKLAAYIKRVTERLGPKFGEVCSVIDKMMKGQS